MLTLMNTNNNDTSLSDKVKVNNKLMPTPYGAIPKRNKKSISASKKNTRKNVSCDQIICIYNLTAKI